MDARRGCPTAASLGMDIMMAFQPIVDIGTGSIFAGESLSGGGTGSRGATCGLPSGRT